MSPWRKSGRLRAVGLVAAGCALGVAITLVGGARADRSRDPSALVTAGQLARAEHRKVDLLLERGDVDGALAALTQALDAPWPGPERAGAAVIPLRRDLVGRWARLALDHPGAGAPSPAQVRRRLLAELGDSPADAAPDPFTARLWALLGEAYEADGQDDEALAAYQKALDMNRALLDALLTEEDGAP